MRPCFLSPQIEETGRGTESSATAVATATRRGAVRGTISMSSTGTRTTITGTGGTWTATVLGATGPTTCLERDPTTSTAVTETTGDTEITTTGVREALGHRELSFAESFTVHWGVGRRQRRQCARERQ